MLKGLEMKKIVIIGAVALLSIGFNNAFADKWVKGYTKKDGTYVGGYMRSSPDKHRYNNRNSQSRGGSQRDEYSSGWGATNKSNPSYKWRDNDNDGVNNAFDRD